MRARWLVLGLPCLAALGAAAACTSFSTDGGQTPDASAPEAPPADAPVKACAIPTPATPVTACTDCAPTALFGKENAELAIVAGSKMYIARAGALYATTNIETGTFTQLDEGPAFTGTVTSMAVDEGFVYVSTTTQHVRVPVGGGPVTPVPLFQPDPGAADPVFVGTSSVYQLHAQRVTRTPKAATSPDAGIELAVTATTALAVDGDAAYWIGASSSAEQVIQGPFPAPTVRGAVSASVVGFVVKDQLAYVAELSATGTGSAISRVDLGDSTRARLTDEPGKIESLHLWGQRLYWIALRVPAEGSRVFASVDLCGGPTTLLAKDLPQLRSTVSFDDRYAYAASAKADAVYRMKK